MTVNVLYLFNLVDPCRIGTPLGAFGALGATGDSLYRTPLRPGDEGGGRAGVGSTRVRRRGRGSNGGAGQNM